MIWIPNEAKQINGNKKLNNNLEKCLLFIQIKFPSRLKYNFIVLNIEQLATKVLISRGSAVQTHMVFSKIY